MNQNLESYVEFVKTQLQKIYPDASERELEALYRNGYSKYRSRAYPAIGDQMDMQYHDAESWRTAINAVKTAFPKPTEEDMAFLERFRGRHAPKITVIGLPSAGEQ